MKTIKITVKPNSPETKIISERGADLVIAVHAPAEKNKANIELIKFLKKPKQIKDLLGPAELARLGHFRAEVRIVRGAASRKKIVQVFD